MATKAQENSSRRKRDMEQYAIFLFRSGLNRKSVTEKIAYRFYLGISTVWQIIDLKELNQKYSVSSAGEQLTAKSTEVSNSATMIESARSR